MKRSPPSAETARPTAMNAPDGERRRAGLSFIPIQKNPKFSIKRNVTLF
jgi:hypothetical protein